MDFFKNDYYKINRLTLVIIGFWPYQNIHVRVIKGIVIFFILGLLWFTMLFKMIIAEWSIEFMTYAIQFVIPATVHTVNIMYFPCHAENFRVILDHIKSDWDIFQPDDARIVKKYAERGKHFTLILTLISSIMPPIQLIGFQLLQDSSATNHTGQLELPLPVDYLVDHRKYIYYIFVHMFLAVDLGMVVTATAATFYLICVQHACGVFEVAGHRLETMFNDLKEDEFVYKQYEVMWGKFLYSVLYHTRAIQFCEHINDFFGPIYLYQVLLLVGLLSSDIFRLYQAYKYEGDVIISVLHLFGVLLCLTVFSVTGQQLLDHSSNIFDKAYQSRWYLAPLSIQKPLIVIMLRSLKESSIRITKSITVSLEMLGTILQMGVSYFMAIYSLQQE